MDTYFNYHLASFSAPETPRDAIAPRYVAAADAVLNNYDRSRGLCLVIGSQTGELAMELARRGNLRVIGLETDATQIGAAREKAMALGIHGPRCSFVQVASLENLPVPQNIANLVVSQSALEGEPPAAAELVRVLQPGSGQLVLLRKIEGDNPWKKLRTALQETGIILRQPENAGEYALLAGTRNGAGGPATGRTCTAMLPTPRLRAKHSAA